MIERLLTVEQLAELLVVPVKTVYRWRSVHEGPPAYRVGKHIRFRTSDVEQWLATRRDDNLGAVTGRLRSGVGR